jgi:hypothetical protein
MKSIIITFSFILVELYFSNVLYTSKCPTKCLGKCDGKTGLCEGGCQRGFCGQKCDQLCNVGCDTQEKNCQQSDCSCEGHCKKGYNGTKCENCSKTYYGESCEMCPVHCDNISTCNDTINGNGTCRGCKDGFYGDKCQYACSIGCKNYTCNQIDGGCDCVEGFFGYDCRQCSSDNPGYYGEQCLKCSVHCLNSCDNNGTCIGCNSAFYGNNCDKRCNPGCDLSDGGSCDQTTGKCTKCLNGFAGEKCENCDVGFYKPNCEACPMHCANGCTHGTCDQCEYSYWGEKCDQKCSTGCDLINGNCNQTDGTCTLCKPNFRGDNCSECVEGKWGKDNCDKNCNDKCVGSCNRTTGTCTKCLYGYWGDVCHNDCGYGCDLSQGNCEKGSGNCTCLNGFTLPSCTICLPNKWGKDCLECYAHCNGTCDNYGNCTNGCIQGFYGQRCENECSFGCNSSCNQVTGNCNNGCKEGFDGDKCSQCKDGYYDSTKCEICPTHCVGTCDNNTGNCQTCESGFHGLRCEESCSIGCLSRDCEPISGNCTITTGCREGYKLHDCVHCEEKYYLKDNSIQKVCEHCPVHCKENKCHEKTGFCTNGIDPLKFYLS